MDPRLFLDLFYIIALIGLTSVGLWDVHNIILDYIYDNRVTSVKPLETNFDYPFLTDPIICIYYNTSLFPVEQNWTKFRYPFGENILDNTTRNLLHLYMAYNIVKTIDHQGPDILQIYARDFETDQSDIMIQLDKFLTDPKQLEKTRQAWLDVRNAFIGREDFSNQEIHVHSIHEASICIKPPLSRDLNPRNSSITYGLDGYYTPNHSGFAMDYRSKMYGSTVFFPEAEPVHTYADSKDVIFKSNTEIFIFNTALIDQSRFRECTSDYVVQADCWEDKKLEIIGEICQCLPFSLMLKNVFKNKPTEKYNTICTTKKYEQCWAKGEAEWEKRKKNIFCNPCLLPKNRYPVQSLDEVPFNRGDSDWKYNIFYVFKCADRNYLLFEEKPQFTLSQFISQIGGDLGLYIGFSMVGVLRLVLYLCDSIGRHDVRDENDEEGTTKCGRRLKYILRYAVDHDRASSDAGKKDGTASELREMRNGTWQEAIEILRNRIERNEKVMLEKLEGLERLINAR